MSQNMSQATQAHKAKRTFYRSSITRRIEKVNDDAEFGMWTKGQLKENANKIREDQLALDEAVVLMISEEDNLDQEFHTENSELDDAIVQAKAKISDRLDELNAQSVNVTNNQEETPKNFTIEVQATDAAGNLPNTWGTFDGDYAKWKSFRDRWLSLHKNTKVKTLVKFQNLKTACIGAAAGAVGEWDLTDENYTKAWDRLCSIYDDDYMQVQSFMQILKTLPRMKKSSSGSIRNVIDTVQKHINGLKQYNTSDHSCIYAVFAVIDKMDTETYRAWEKHRRALAKAELQANEANVEGSVKINIGKYIPKWSELELFLEGEVAIRVHAENRGEAEPVEQEQNQNTFNKRFNRNKRFKHTNDNKRGDVPEFLRCVLCPSTHPLYKCEAFKAMNLTGRKEHIKEHELCAKCLRPNHSGPCADDRNNRECPQCKPAIRFHNSSICPNSELKVRTAMLAQEGNRKRKYTGKANKGNKAKRKRTHDGKPHKSNDSMQSSVLKVGDWQLVNNAIKQINKSDKGELEYTVILATMNIKIETKNYVATICRALLDSGATLCCITEQFVEENNLRTIKCQKLILGVSGPEIIKRKLIAHIRPHFTSDVSIEIEFYVLNSLNGSYPSHQIEASKDQIIHLNLADEKFDSPAPIDALLGAEIYAEIMGTDIYRHKSGAIMQSTSFGHIILGKFNIKKSVLSDLPVLNILSEQNKMENENLSEALTRFWEIEDTDKCDNKAILSEEGKVVESLFIETFYREKSGRYVVTIPIKPNCQGLGDSKRIALKQFLQLEEKLERQPEIKAKYVDFINEYKKLGYLKPASVTYDPKFAFWLPHHAVIRKFRVVVNGSQKTTSGESLNSIQMTGDKLQLDLELQLVRFRKHKIGVATDISKMFNNIGLNKKQWNLQRFFWRESPKDELKEYVITVVMFGLKSSPFNAVRTLKQCARDQAEKFPKAAQIIENCFYIDDGIFGCDTVNEAKILCKEIEFVLNNGNFPLKNWLSNAKELEAYMNAKTKDELILGDDETKILGVKWNKNSDELGIVVKELQKPIKFTKRAILKEIASLYDPNGYLAPVVIVPKMLMQSIWRLNDINWDDEVPHSIKKEWVDFYSNLSLLSSFKLKRWLKTDAKSKIQIHAFCDASEKAYGTAIYIRVENSGGIHCALLSAKSRVAPIKTVTIPRLELLAAVVLSDQLEAILEACQFNAQSVTCWTDSSIALHWINKEPQDLKAFVSNRVKKIQEKTKGFNWKHVSSQDNPADLVSRGMKISEFLKSNLWTEGPPWLKKSEANWPIAKVSVSPDARKEISKEYKAKIDALPVLSLMSCDRKTLLYEKYNDWNTILNITAYYMRIPLIARKDPNRHTGRYIYADERNKAARFWIKHEQQNYFKKEIECIRSNEKLPMKSDIAPLRPILDENGLLRVGGRIDKANIKYDKKHPYIIPSKSRLSYLLLSYSHKENLHGGVQAMMHFIRKRFWIPKLRQEARTFVHSCVQCVRQAQNTAKQIMAELPEVRIKPALTFINVGIDMAGPYNMRITDKLNFNTRGRQLPEIKGWIVVFVCLVTRAVHLEATEGLSTDDFLAAYERFISRRGNPELVFSDNGTNFIGANNELKKAFESWKAEKIQHWVHNNGTQWHFITPSAPHEGGIWEAAVKSMKHHLKRVIGSQKYSLHGMNTLLAGIEACLNSRPLCALSDDINDCEALTPAHFLLGRSLKLPLHEKTVYKAESLKRLHKAARIQTHAFWQLWSEDYLQSLMQLPKWREEQDNFKEGQLVLIKSENIPPTYWAMGRVIKTHKGADGKVRSVTLKTQSGTLDRSIRKLCVLPVDVEVEHWEESDKN